MKEVGAVRKGKLQQCRGRIRKGILLILRANLVNYKNACFQYYYVINFGI